MTNLYLYKNKPIIEHNGTYYNADTLEPVVVLGRLEDMPLRLKDRYRDVMIVPPQSEPIIDTETDTKTTDSINDP